MIDLYKIQISDKYNSLLERLSKNLSFINKDDLDFLEALEPSVEIYEYVIHIGDHLKDTACYTCKWKNGLTPSCYDGHIQGKKICEWHQERT